jgi:hypothetical protein
MIIPALALWREFVVFILVYVFAQFSAPSFLATKTDENQRKRSF